MPKQGSGDTSAGSTPAANADTRARILDTALRLFAERGFAATPTKTIAQEAGVATGLLFYYFPSKQALLEALLEERSFAPELKAILKVADPADPRGTLREVGRRFEVLLREHQDFVRVLLTTAGPGTAALERFQALLRGELTRLSDYLLTAFGTERLPPRQARAVARAFMATIVYSTVVVSGNDDPETYVEDTIEALLGPDL